jgi:hypothetical protein
MIKTIHDIPEHIIKWVPKVPLDREWDDYKIKKYFNL